MKQLIIALVIIALSGCSMFRPKPVVVKFPESSIVLTTACPQLDILPDDTTKLSEFEKTVAKNYKKYHDCAATVTGWIEWYTLEKKNYESLK